MNVSLDKPEKAYFKLEKEFCKVVTQLEICKKLLSQYSHLFDEDDFWEAQQLFEVLSEQSKETYKGEEWGKCNKPLYGVCSVCKTQTCQPKDNGEFESAFKCKQCGKYTKMSMVIRQEDLCHCKPIKEK